MSGAGGEQERIERVYAGYREDRRRRRAWSAENAGNAAIREEVLRTLLELAPHALAGEGAALDAGCGTGRGLGDSRARASPRAGWWAWTCWQNVSGPPVRWSRARVLAGDVRSLPLPAGACTLVMLFTVLSAMGSREDVRTALGEARRVLAREVRSPSGSRGCGLPTPTHGWSACGELRAWCWAASCAGRTLTLLPPLARRVKGRLVWTAGANSGAADAPPLFAARY